MKRKILSVFTICLITCSLLAGCGQNAPADATDNTKEEETVAEDKAEKPKEKKKKEKTKKKRELDPAAAEEKMKEMINALSGFMWASMMKETDYNLSAPENIELRLSDEEKIRAAVLAGNTDNVIDSNFILEMGGFSEDKNAETGPCSDGYHGMSVSKKDVENNCLDLFGTKASWDDLPRGPVCELYDAVRYEKGNDSYALIVDREEESETAFENHECTVEKEDGKYVGKVNMFWGYWGELDLKPGYSNYVATYDLEPDDESKYGMVIKAINISRLHNEVSNEPFYGLWVGSSTDKQESLDLVKDLKDKGLDAFCIYTPEWENLNSGRYWCVTVGKSESEERANELIADVEKAGYNGSYVKYTGARISNRIYYYMYSPGDAAITTSKVTLNDVPTEALSGYEEDEGPMTLIVDSDTVFDKTCDMQFFPGYKEGESPLEWFNSASGEDIMGVFEVGITGNHVDSFYGSYWWD